ncbi:MAG: hydrogenase small subunit [Desulfofustis sp.]|nr:hydrogenase small subunit [Desulfofustis sp.]
MKFDRRRFLKYCIGSAAALGLPMQVLGRLEEALAADETGLPKVIWLSCSNCTGCTVSLSNLISDSGPADIADLLLNTIELSYHTTLMGAAGDLAVQQLNETAQGSYILVVEGGVPTAFDGHTCLLWTDNGHEYTALEAVQMLAPGAAAILSIGTCASHGGIPGGSPNPTGIISASQATGLPTINIPGCPTHPDWIVWTVANLLAGVVPTLDTQSRPTALFSRKIHDRCPYEDGIEAKTFGIRNACMEELGCKGERTRGDCPVRRWNNASNWCVGAGNICTACTERGFPDNFSPFYKIEYRYELYEKTGTGTAMVDSLNSLRVLSGQETAPGWVGADVDGDGKVGLAEAISALRDIGKP